MLFDIFDSVSDLFSDSWNDIWSPVSDWASGYTSSNAANRFYQENLELQQKYNLENMARQQGYNLSNMKKTDEYQRKLMADSPSIQVQALRNAGLNPLLAVSNGISSANTAVHASNPTSSAPSASMPSVSPQIGVGDVASGLGALVSLGSLSADLGLKAAQTRAADSSAAASSAQAFKATQEALSIDPDLEKELKSTAKSDIMKLGNDLMHAVIPDSWKTSARSSTDSAVDKVSTTSAEGLDKATRYIVDESLPRMRHELNKRDVSKPKRRHN